MSTELLSVHVLGTMDLNPPFLGLRCAFNRRRATQDGSVWDGRSYPLIKRWCQGDGRVVDYDGRPIGMIQRCEDQAPGIIVFTMRLDDALLLTSAGLWRAAFWGEVIDIRKRTDRPEERLVVSPTHFVLWKEIPKPRLLTEERVFQAAMQNVRRLEAA